MNVNAKVYKSLIGIILKKPLKPFSANIFSKMSAKAYL